MFLLLTVSACKKVEAAPEDVDGLLHFLWQNVELGEDEQLAEGVANLHVALDGGTRDEVTDGTVSRLVDAEVEPLGVTRDPALAAGIFIGNVIACDLPMVAEIVTHPDQDELYKGVYESYERTYRGDIGRFLAGDPDELEWSLDYGAEILGSSYTGHTEALLRRIDASTLPDLDLPFSEAYLARFFAPEAAVFEEGSEKTFEQDYQFEVYWDRGGETLHAYAMWRQADWGVGFTSEEEGVQRILLNGMAAWDTDTEKICEDGGP